MFIEHVLQHSHQFPSLSSVIASFADQKGGGHYTAISRLNGIAIQ